VLCTSICYCHIDRLPLSSHISSDVPSYGMVLLQHFPLCLGYPMALKFQQDLRLGAQIVIYLCRLSQHLAFLLMPLFLFYCAITTTPYPSIHAVPCSMVCGMCFNLVPLRSTTNLGPQKMLHPYALALHMTMSCKCFKPVQLRDSINIGLNKC
jgi:hypothetical protein